METMKPACNSMWTWWSV